MHWKLTLALIVSLVLVLIAVWRPRRRRGSHMMLPEWCARLRALPDPLAAPARRAPVALQSVSDIVGARDRV